jgi:hypothetical protein
VPALLVWAGVGTGALPLQNHCFIENETALDVDFEIDLAAEMLAAERAGEKIAVEIKSFIGRSNVSEFHTALGQFMNYQFAIEEFDPQRKLYLAIPDSVYQSFFQRRFTRSVVERTRINLLVYNEKQELIVQWQ